MPGSRNDSFTGIRTPTLLNELINELFGVFEQVGVSRCHVRQAAGECLRLLLNAIR